ncbi:MAG: hypothetical protein QNJ22_05690 [Desulfosarcinaceae bacterium]|nr:hypothetical protein [Desulfosarcinaceae bacterium]
MYFPYFVTYIVVGLLLGLITFGWALHSGQFRDQQRARFLPLVRSETPAATSKFGRLETYVLMGMACIGLLISAFTLIYSLLRG